MSNPRKIDDRETKELRKDTWHAVQICWLSSSNSILWSWNPVVIAALVYSGPFTTYSGQQHDLLEHLPMLEKASEWILDHKIRKLLEVLGG